MKTISKGSLCPHRKVMWNNPESPKKKKNVESTVIIINFQTLGDVLRSETRFNKFIE